MTPPDLADLHSLIAAARSTADESTRVVYAARARVAFSAAEEQLARAKISLESLEKTWKEK